jgi:predicted PurR-regulated permease PerM
MVEPIKALWFVIFIIVLQQVESNLIYPRVVGTSVGLPGIWVLLAVSVGAASFGILGILVAVPLSAVLYSLLRRTVDRRLIAKGKSE